MKTAGLFRRLVPMLVLAAGACVSSGCATRLHGLSAHYLEPEYVVTKDFFAEAPQRVAVLPFGTHQNGPAAAQAADVCRKTFYQHLALRDYDTASLRFSDALMLGTNEAQRLISFGTITKTIRALDLVGVTTLLDLDALTSHGETIPRQQFFEMISTARTNAHADACCIGVTRKFGRLYAVLFSSVGISTRVEMWSTTSGKMLWAAEMKDRNLDAAITIDILSIPTKLWDVWLNSRGYTLGTLAYDVYGHINETMPYLPFPTRTVGVEVTKNRARAFKEISPFMFWSSAKLDKGTRLEFLREENGWYQCKLNGNGNGNGNITKPFWIFRDDARLVDVNGVPLRPRADYVPIR
jgi:hypothetical protein